MPGGITVVWCLPVLSTSSLDFARFSFSAEWWLNGVADFNGSRMKGAATFLAWSHISKHQICNVLKYNPEWKFGMDLIEENKICVSDSCEKKIKYLFLRLQGERRWSGCATLKFAVRPVMSWHLWRWLQGWRQPASSTWPISTRLLGALAAAALPQSLPHLPHDSCNAFFRHSVVRP